MSPPGKLGVAFSADVHDYGVDGTFRVLKRQGSALIPSDISLDCQAKATEDWSFDRDYVVYNLVPLHTNYD